MQMTSFHQDPALQDVLFTPAFAEHREAILWAANATDEELLPEKLLAVRKDTIRKKIEAMAVEHPNWTLRDAVLHVLQDLPDSIPPAMLLELTRFTIEQWESAALDEAIALT